eukprot:242164-Chlamydomonas_euryale.AAC.1
MQRLDPRQCHLAAHERLAVQPALAAGRCGCLLQRAQRDEEPRDARAVGLRVHEPRQARHLACKVRRQLRQRR